MNNITIVFCEGQHDIAFLTKILLLNGYEGYKNKLCDFLKPFGEQYITELKNIEIDKRKLSYNPTPYKIPSISIFKDNELVLFHNLHGDGREKERNEILKMYKNLQGGDDFSSSFNLNFKFLYFFDADEKGVDLIIENLNKELKLSEKINHSQVGSIDSYEWGCYVFHKDIKSGVLEDILLDLMISSNEKIFENSKEFIKNNLLDVERQKEFICHTGRYKNICKFKEKKSIISIAGQLQFSSMSNAVIIANSDYIKKEDIDNNKCCKDIIKLFNIKEQE